MLKKLTLASERVSQKLSPGLRKIVHSVGWLSAERVLSMIVNLTIGIYVIRYLGASDFGLLSYALSFVGLFYALTSLGLDSIVLRNLLRAEKLALKDSEVEQLGSEQLNFKQATAEIVGTAFVLKTAGSLVTLILVNCIIWSGDNSNQLNWIINIVTLGYLARSFDVIDFWFKSKVLGGEIAKVKVGKIVFSSLAKLIFIALKLPLIAFVWLVIVDLIVIAGGMVWVYRQQNQSIFNWQFKLTQAFNMLKDAWPLLLSGVMIDVYMKIDQVMLGKIASSEAVGNYAAAVRFSEVWHFLPVAICASVFPAIFRAKEQGKKQYYGKLQQLYDLMAWLSLAIAVPMVFIAVPLMSSLLGEGYAEAGKILVWHIWASPFVFLGVASSQWLVAENFTKFSFVATMTGAVVNIFLNLWLIPTQGAVGAAIATIIAHAVVSHLICLFHPKMFKTGWMLTKALFIPLRVKQNLIYLRQLKEIIS